MCCSSIAHGRNWLDNVTALAQPLEVDVANTDPDNAEPPPSAAAASRLHVQMRWLLSITLHDWGMDDTHAYWALFRMEAGAKVL
jgi:hypothetical protein